MIWMHSPYEADIAELGKKMRIEDAREVWLTGHMLPEQAVRKSVEMSEDAYAVTDKNETLLCLFGVTPLDADPDVGVPWLLATDAMTEHPISILREGRAVIEAWRTCYRALFNMVHVENRASICWLKWLGFKIENAVPYGAEQAMFHAFVLEGE